MSVVVALGSVPFERLFASLDVTVVDETCRLPDERRPLEEPKIMKEFIPITVHLDARLAPF